MKGNRDVLISPFHAQFHLVTDRHWEVGITPDGTLTSRLEGERIDYHLYENNTTQLAHAEKMFLISTTDFKSFFNIVRSLP